MNKDFIIILSGKILQVIIMVLTLKVSTHYLSPKEMGNIYMILVISSLITLSVFNPVGMYIHRHVNAWREDKLILKVIIYFFVFILFFSFFVVFILYIYSCVRSIPVDFSLTYFLLIIFFYSIFVFINPYIAFILNMLNYRINFTIITILTSVGNVMFGYIFMNIFGFTAINWLFGMILSNFIFMICSFVSLKNKLQENFQGLISNTKKLTKNKIKEILYFLIPLSIATLFMWAQRSGYRIIIEKNIGLNFLGFFGVGMAIASQISTVVEAILMQYFNPIYYKKITNTTLENRTKAINELINKILPIYFLLAIFLTFLAKYILEILVDEKYYGASIFVAFGVWVEFFRMFANLLGNISQSEFNTKKVVFPYVIGSLVTTILVYVVTLGSNYQLLLPISLMLGGFVTTVIMFFSMKKLIDFHVNYKLLFISFIISIPYCSTYYINVKSNIYTNLLILIVFGLYFLGSVFYIYKKGLSYASR